MAKRRLVVEVDCEDRYCGGFPLFARVLRPLRHNRVQDLRCTRCLAAEVKEPADG